MAGRRCCGRAAGPAGRSRPPGYGHVAGGRLCWTGVERRLGPVVGQRARVDRAVQRRLERRDGGHYAAGRRAVAAPGERQQIRRVRALPVRTAAERVATVDADAFPYAATTVDAGLLVA